MSVSLDGTLPLSIEILGPKSGAQLVHRRTASKESCRNLWAEVPNAGQRRWRIRREGVHGRRQAGPPTVLSVRNLVLIGEEGWSDDPILVKIYFLALVGPFHKNINHHMTITYGNFPI